MNKCYLVIFCMYCLCGDLSAQPDTRAHKFTGVVYDDQFKPVPYTHVIASGTSQGDVTDTLGIFTLYIRDSDRLSFLNLTCHDTTVAVSIDDRHFYIKLRRKAYALREAKIFDWGSSYDDLLRESERLGVPQSAGAKLDLPRQDDDIVPFDLDEKSVKSSGFLISSPVSYLYYNLSRREKARRKAFRLQQDEGEIDQFNMILSRQNLNDITGLEGEKLESFIIFLNQRLHCDHSCSELELLTEMHGIWNSYKSLGKDKE